MIKIIKGDILEASEDVIAHQVNCQGVMGSGVAKQIKEKYPEVYKKYKNYVNNFEFKSLLLGNCQIVETTKEKYIANLFGQFGYGIKEQQTNYKALEESLFSLKVSAKDNHKTLALPFKIGCGRGGGDWDIVYKIIEDVFQDYDVTLYQYDEI